MTPTHVVASVGSEVVLLAGICGPEGCFVTRQPIQWLLSQDSVGNFLDSAEDPRFRACGWLSQPESRLSGDFAVSQTSTRAQVVTRGTPSLDDDVWVKKGQSWISITSSAVGASYVTVMAPGAENWARRRQTATVHWIDAQWIFPGPAIVRAGQPLGLTTTLTRASDGKPASGWVVRYEVASGAPATFGPKGPSAIEVRSDASGQATVQLVPQTAQPGVTHVQVQILMPSSDGGVSATATVGQGSTYVTWSSPGLAVRVSGSESVAVDATATFRIEVSNPGDLATRNVVVSSEIPPFLKFTSSTPAAERYEPRVQWLLGDLQPREIRLLELNCRALREGDVRLCARAQADGNLAADNCASLQIVAPSLEVQFVKPPTAAKVGDKVTFDVEISNIGPRRITNLVARDAFDPGLEHTGGEVSPIARTLGDLEPKGVRGFSVSFFVRKPGRLCHTLTLTAAGGHEAVARACLDVTQLTLALDVTISGPAQQRLGDSPEFIVRVANTGQGALTGVRLAFSTVPALGLAKATDGFQYQDGTLNWVLGVMQPNESQSRNVLCSCVKADAGAVTRAVVTSLEGITRTATASTEILAAAGPAPQPPRQPLAPEPKSQPLPPGSGQLIVSVDDMADPVRVGSKTTYVVTVQNDRQVSDRDVTVTFVLPAGMRFEQFDSGGLPLAEQRSPDGRTIALPPIKELRAGETLRAMRVVVTATQPGLLRFRTEVKSLRSPEPIVAEEETQVQAD